MPFTQIKFLFNQISAKLFSQMVVTHKYQKWTNPRVIPDHCNKAQAKNGTKLLLVVSLVLVTHQHKENHLCTTNSEFEF